MQELSSIAYTSIDDAGRLINLLGKGAKFDLWEAYRAVPVHPADQPKLGVNWKGVTFVDRALPFGLPKLFSALTDGFMWALHRKGMQHALHYLDDFLILGQAKTQTCQESLTMALSLCDQVGLPVAPEKTEGPTTKLPGYRAGYPKYAASPPSGEEDETPGSHGSLDRAQRSPSRTHVRKEARFTLSDWPTEPCGHGSLDRAQRSPSRTHVRKEARFTLSDRPSEPCGQGGPARSGIHKEPDR